MGCNVSKRRRREYIYIYIYLYIYITRLASNEIFSPSNKIYREVGRAKDLSAPQYSTVHSILDSAVNKLRISESKKYINTIHRPTNK